MIVLTGVTPEEGRGNPHIVVSDDRKAAVWVGVIDDLWQLGKPVGHGGPWKNTQVNAGEKSDPYLCGFYDKKILSLSHQSDKDVVFTIEADPTGNGDWMEYAACTVKPGETWKHTFPETFQARWIRFASGTAARVTAWLEYE
jgi:hypothetical protein